MNCSQCRDALPIALLIVLSSALIYLTSGEVWLSRWTLVEIRPGLQKRTHIKASVFVSMNV